MWVLQTDSTKAVVKTLRSFSFCWKNALSVSEVMVKKGFWFWWVLVLRVLGVFVASSEGSEFRYFRLDINDEVVHLKSFVLMK